MPAMLKVARIPDEEAGYRLLTWWDGQGAARVFASAAGALLMERASGAGDLAQIAWSGQDDEACRIIISHTTFVEVLLALKNLPHLPLNLKHKMNAIVVVNLFIAAYNGYK
ncbi:hypothetical protein LRP14_27300 [Klebsiella pneumoniae]|nr:hypothetical protein [Klebsiella pneumoniae]